MARLAPCRLLDRKPTTLKYQPRAGQRLGIELTSKGALKIRTRRGEQSMTSDLLAGELAVRLRRGALVAKKPVPKKKT